MLDGKITIGMRHSNVEKDYYHITLVDKLSGTTFLEIKMTLEDFATALGNRGDIPCQFGLHPQLVGKKREHKTELVECNPWELSKDERKARMSAYEVDGWEGRENDLENYHKWSDKGILVVFERHVDV